MSAAEQFNGVEERTVVEEHELVVEGNTLKERQEMTIVGERLNLTHTRWINDKMYEVNETRMRQEVSDQRINTSLEGNNELETFKKEWERMWHPSITQEEIGGIGKADESSEGLGSNPRQPVVLISKPSVSRSGIATKDEKEESMCSGIAQPPSIKSSGHILIEQTIGTDDKSDESITQEEIGGIGKADESSEGFGANPRQPVVLISKPSESRSGIATKDDKEEEHLESINIGEKEMVVTLKPSQSSSITPTVEQGADEQSHISLKPMHQLVDHENNSATRTEDGMRVSILEPNQNESESEGQQDGSVKKPKKRSARKAFTDFFRRPKKN